MGEALRRLFAAGVVTRDDVFVQTKFTSFDGQDPARCPYDPKLPLAEQVRVSFATSQSELGIDKVDSLVLHGPLSRAADTLAVWRAMEAIHTSGLASQLGVSNFYSLKDFRAFYAKATIKPAVLQNRWYGETRHDGALRRFCREHGIVYQSFWTLTGNPQLLASAAVKRAARRTGKTAEQVLFRFLMHRGVAPLTGTCSAEHMAQDLGAWHGSNKFTVSPSANAESAAADSAATAAGATESESWDLTEQEVTDIGALVEEDCGDGDVVEPFEAARAAAERESATK